MKKPKKSIATIDFETDPFVFGQIPEPFCAGYYSIEYGFQHFWGDNCVYDLCQFLETLPPQIIYAHNGGKFDAYFLLKINALTNPALIINGRITKCGLLGKHELRDSYALIPCALAKMSVGAKIEIDYGVMARDKREENKDEIVTYLRQDCKSLYVFVSAFVERFGPKLTIGSVAIGELGKLHPVRRLTKKHDADFRSYYFGGRVECFEYGEIDGQFEIVDINSSYPNSMRNFDHPGSAHYIYMGEVANKHFDHKTGKIKKYGDFYFAHIIAHNNGCLPTRITEGRERGRLTFNVPYGEFFACSHEIQAGIELGILHVERIIEAHIPSKTQRFEAYVDKFIAEKIEAQENNDEIKILMAKLILCSSYGKFATDPGKFRDWFIRDLSDDDNCQAFDLWYADKIEKQLCPEKYQDMISIELWQSKCTDDNGYFDVAVGASITSASRAVLLRAIHGAKRPLYCDTDSLICEQSNVELHDTKLGAWKNEGYTDKIYIAGKKMYACKLYDSTGNPVIKNGVHKTKIASKGAVLSYNDIANLCNGTEIVWQNAAPNFKLTGETKFVERKINKLF